MNRRNKNKWVPKLRFPEFVNEEEWEETGLGKLGDFINGLTYSPEDVRETGLLVLRVANIKDGKIMLKDCVYVREDIKDANLSKPNDILICVQNGSKSLIGKNALIPEGLPVSTPDAFMKVLRAENPKFVYQLFQTDFYLKQVSNPPGTATNSAIGSRLANYEFAVPKPEEQQKIAAFLSSLDDLITAEDQKLEALKTHKKGLLQNLFPAEGETVPDLRFEEFKNAGEWEETLLGNLGYLINGLKYGPEDVRETGLPVLASSNIKDGKIILKDCVYVRENMEGANLYKPDDILICVRDRSMSLIGKNALIPEGFPASIHDTFMTVLRANNPKFVYQLLQTDCYLKQINNDYGAKINSTHGRNLMKYMFAVPKPEEQQKIASCLTSLDEFITAQSQKVEDLMQHKKGLMQGLFPDIYEVNYE